MTPSIWKRIAGGRRGANAAEFALVSPVLFAMVLGTLDYGYFFNRQNQVVAAVNGAVRAASNVTPGIGDGGCDRCIDTASAQALVALDAFGIDIDRDQVTPTIQRLEGTCALVLDTTIDHTPLVSFVAVPHQYRIEVVSLLQNVTDC